MSMKVRNKLVAVTMAAATALSMGAPMVTNAATGVPNAPTSAITESNGVATVGAHKAAETAPLILGGELVTGDATSFSDLELAVFGSDYNQVPSIYLWNYNYKVNGGGTDAPEDLTAKKLEKTAAPNMADTYVPAGDSTSVTLSMTPNILFGIAPNMMFQENGNEAIPVCRTYDALIAQTGMTGYTPIQQAYDDELWLDLSTMSNVMYDLAAEISEESEDGNGRYGDPGDVAADYEAFVKETQLAVLAWLQTTNQEKAVVAVLDGGYDEKAGTYTVSKFTGDPGRSSNRAAEYLQYTTTNVIDALGLKTSESGIAEVTEDQLVSAGVDCLIFTGMDRGGALTMDDVDDLVKELKDDEVTVRAMKGAPTGAYGVYMNAVDNALAMAVENAFVYDNKCFEMEDAIAYFYENLYHVNDGAAVATVVNAGFEDLKDEAGNPLVTFDPNKSQFLDVVDYEGVLLSGFEYYTSSGQTFPDGLQLSENLYIPLVVEE